MFCEYCRLRIYFKIGEERFNYRRSLKETGDRRKFWHGECIKEKINKENEENKNS